MMKTYDLDRLARSALDAGGSAAAGGCGPGAGVSVLDAASIARLRELDPDGQQGVLSRVLGAYRQSLERHLGDMASAAARDDKALLRRAAHTLKSSSAAVGALDFSQHCAGLEEACRDADRAVPSDRVEALIHEGRQVMAAVAAMLDA